MANTFLEEEEISGVKVVHSKANPKYSPQEAEARTSWKNFISENNVQEKQFLYRGSYMDRRIVIDIWVRITLC